MQMSMLIRQLDGFHPHKIRKLRANSNSNSKLELDVVGNSCTVMGITGIPLVLWDSHPWKWKRTELLLEMG